MRERRLTRIEATPEAEDAWTTHVDEAAAATLFPLVGSCSWGRTPAGKKRTFLTYAGGAPA